jgi:transcriptional antiterminator NusG
MAAEKKWYVIQTYSGFEAKVRDALQQRLAKYHMEDKFGEILLPSETIKDQLPGGKTRVRQKLSLPGYIFVQMEFTDEVWHLVKDTPKVTGFIGNQKPQEVPARQVEALRRGIVEGAAKPRVTVNFDLGDDVRVLEGPLATLAGKVDEVNADKQKLKVKLSIFGRETSVELDFSSVEKVVHDKSERRS